MATLRKTFDPSKFQKHITKSIPNISTGFNDPKIWIDTGCYALNKRISNDFFKGIPLGKISIFAGESGSGKSFLCSGSITRHAQQAGIFCVIIDTENALDESWLHAVEVDTAPDKLMRIGASMVDDVAKIFSDFVKEYKSEWAGVPREEQPPILFVIDSLGMLLTPVETNQFESGDMKGDMGRKAKQIRSLVANITNLIADYNIGVVMTNHTYKSQDQFNPDDVISGGGGQVFASSIIISMRKGKLKEDEGGSKTSDVHGIRAMAQVVKTRYAKPFEKIEIKIPYSTGLDPYTGLFDLFEQQEVIKKSGNKYIYTDLSGQEHKYFRKEYERNTDGICDRIMAEWNQSGHDKKVEVEDEEVEENATETNE